jgi:hypothetical protein
LPFGDIYAADRFCVPVEVWPHVGASLASAIPLQINGVVDAGARIAWARDFVTEPKREAAVKITRCVKRGAFAMEHTELNFGSAHDTDPVTFCPSCRANAYLAGAIRDIRTSETYRVFECGCGRVIWSRESINNPSSAPPGLSQ